MTDIKDDMIPNIPDEWDIVPLRYSVSSIETGDRDSSFTPSKEDPGVLSIGGEHFDWDGTWKLESPRYIGTEMYQNMKQGKLERGDTLLVKDGATIGKVAYVNQIPEDRAAANSHVYVIKPSEDLKGRLLAYQLQSYWGQSQLQLYIRGSAQAGLPSTFSGELLMILPPSDIQSEIVSYLNHHVGEINSLISKKEDLLELLEEKRKALIIKTTTKGLDEQTLFKDSGIPTIGKIPAHWDVVPNRAIFEEIDDRSKDGSEELLSVSHKTGVTPRSEKDVNMFKADSLEDYKIAQKGDFVINTMWAWMGAVGISPQLGVVSPSYHVYRPNSLMDNEFIDYFYRTDPYITEMGRYSKGVWKSRSRLYPDEFLRMETILPPVSEQKAIANEIQEITEDMDQMVEKLQESIGLLKEKRQAIITETITGQVDISDWEATKEQEVTP